MSFGVFTFFQKTNENNLTRDKVKFVGSFFKRTVGLKKSFRNVTFKIPTNIFWPCFEKTFYKKVTCIQSNHLHLQWKFKLWAGKFAWDVKQNIAGHCQQTFYFQKFVDNTQQCFAFTHQANSPAHNLNFHWRWRWAESAPPG